jgi:hypothetical protein
MATAVKMYNATKKPHDCTGGEPHFLYRADGMDERNLDELNTLKRMWNAHNKNSPVTHLQLARLIKLVYWYLV